MIMCLTDFYSTVLEVPPTGRLILTKWITLLLVFLRANHLCTGKVFMAYERVLIGAKYQHSCKIKLITCWEQGFLSPSFNQNSQVCPPVPFQTGNSIRLIKAKGISARYSKHCNSPLSLSWSCSITHCHRGMGLAGGQGQCMCFLWLRSTFLPFRVTSTFYCLEPKSKTAPEGCSEMVWASVLAEVKESRL